MGTQIENLSLKFENNGPLKDLVINFGKKLNPEKANIHIIVGENGSGKSTVLKTLFFKSYSGSVLPLRIPFKIDPRQRSQLITINNDNFFSDLNPNDPQFQGPSNSEDVFYYTPNEPLILADDSSQLFYAKNKDISNNLIANWVVQYPTVKYLNYVKDLEDTKNKVKLYELGELEVEMPDDLYRIRKSQIPLTIKIKDFVENVYDIKFDFVDTLEGYKPSINGEAFEFSQLSIGYRQIIGLITDILIKVWDAVPDSTEERHKLKFTLLLDEVDIHLHPKAQRKILPALQKMFPNAEIFCTTHSPFVVNSVSEAWVYELDKENYQKSDIGYALNPKISSDGNSFYNVLISDFNLSERFGKDVEDLLAKLRKFIIKVLNKEQSKEDEKAWDEIILPLATRPNEEIKQILAFELTKIDISTEKIISLWQK